jgi:hypothetical protein
MLIAKYVDGHLVVGDYRAFFPTISFPQGGPSAQFLAKAGCCPVDTFLPHDRSTQKLVPVSPYLLAGRALTVKVEQKTPEDLAADVQSQNQNHRAARNMAYAIESDPLFFKWQRGEATKEEWLAAVEDIRARHPYGATP